MTIFDLANYLHLPRKEAAKRLGLSETVVHNIWCKGNGGDGKRRWPHRKVTHLVTCFCFKNGSSNIQGFLCMYQIQSKVKEIMKWRELLSSDDPQVRDRAGVEILVKEEELAQIYRESLFQHF